MRMIRLLTIAAALSSVSCDTNDSLLSRSRRLVGGVHVDVGTRPFMASLQYYDRHICGGTIYSIDIILTAAHCIIGKWYKELSVRLGSSLYHKSGYIYRVAKVAYPQDLAILMNLNDIALLKLESSIEFENLDHVLPVELMGMDYSIPEGAEAVMLGWGIHSSYGAVLSYHLNEVTVKTISKSQCAKEMGVEVEFILSTICTLGSNRGGCSGDSGGPLMINDRQVGVIARGNCAPPFLQFNTQISSSYAWINRSIEELDDPSRQPFVKHPVSEDELWFNKYYQGDEIDIKEAPFLVAVLDPSGAVVCSGSIVDSLHVLTSASCTQQINATHYAILAGSSNLMSGGQLHHIVKFIPHADYQLDKFDKPINDLALIEVSTPFASSLGAIKLYPGGYFDTEATIYGWGEIDPSLRISEEEKFSTKSLQVLIESGNKECGILSDEIGQDEKRFCSSNSNDEGACMSNRGGPLKKGHYLIGIVSWVHKECGDYWYPIIYTEIAPYRGWIVNEITKLAKELR